MVRKIAERDDVLPVLGEVFREHGFEGACLSVISRRTGLGKGSLYNFFPGGKEEMAAAVLATADQWFAANVLARLDGDLGGDLGGSDDAGVDGGRKRVAAMFDDLEGYFRSGHRVCVVGVFALGGIRDHFGPQIRAHFQRWIDSLDRALRQSGLAAGDARATAEEVVAGIQGALVLARGLDDPDVFGRVIGRLRRHCGV